MPGGVGINLSPYHPRFLLLPACLIKLPPSPMHTKAHFSINLRLLLSETSHPLLSLSASFPQSVFKKTYIAAVQLAKRKHVCIYMLFLCLDDFACDYNTTRCSSGCCFILIKFPSSFLLPSCVPACPRSKCQQDLGTWSGIWCHITQRTWIQKTSQHGELTWSAAKPAATR